MTTENRYRSDLQKINNLLQSSMIVYPKELVIAVLKDFFGKDTEFYSFRKDEWGFTKTPDHTDLPLDAGLKDNLTTRIFIGENNRFDIIFYPAIVVKFSGSTSTPIGNNRNQLTIQYKKVLYDDGYGNLTEVIRPDTLNTSGAWESSLTIDIFSKSLRAADEITELVSMCLTEIYFDQLYQAGVVIKPISISGVSTQDDRNDKLFRYSITVPIRTEWLRAIPINNTIEAIKFLIEFDDLSKNDPSPAYNLTIITDILLSEKI